MRYGDVMVTSVAESRPYSGQSQNEVIISLLVNNKVVYNPEDGWSASVAMVRGSSSVCYKSVFSRLLAIVMNL